MRFKPLAAAAAALLALASCSGGEESPAADETIADAARAMAEVENVHFALDVEGDIPDLEVSSAEGTVTADGDAEGTGVITAFGLDVEIAYVIVGDEAHVKGPTGGYQQIEVGGDELPYDPTVILSEDRGVAALLSAYDSAEPQETEEVDGAEAYRYLVTFDPETFQDFIPAAGEWNEATVWFDSETLRVVKAEFAQGDAKVTLHFTDYDQDVAIEAP